VPVVDFLVLLAVRMHNLFVPLLTKHGFPIQSNTYRSPLSNTIHEESKLLNFYEESRYHNILQDV
jgi:hypothetical protein